MIGTGGGAALVPRSSRSTPHDGPSSSAVTGSASLRKAGVVVVEVEVDVVVVVDVVVEVDVVVVVVDVDDEAGASASSGGGRSSVGFGHTISATSSTSVADRPAIERRTRRLDRDRAADVTPRGAADRP